MKTPATHQHGLWVGDARRGGTRPQPGTAVWAPGLTDAELGGGPRPPPVTAAAPPFWNQVGDFPGGLGAHSGENGLRPHATQRPATGQGGKCRVPSFPESRSPPTHRAALVGVTARCDCAPHRRGESGRCGLWWTPARRGHGPDGRGSPRRWERAWRPPRRGHLCSRGRPERPRLPPPSLTPS